MSKLTAATVKSAKPGTIVDGKGLELRTSPTGSQSYLFRYYRPGTKTRAVLTLGKADLITLKEARQLADAARAKVAQGIDPGTEKKAAREAEERKQIETFGAQFADLLDSKRKEASGRYCKALQDRYDQHLAARLGDVPVSEVTAALLVDVVKEIADKGIRDTAGRCGNLVIMVMDWATSGGIIPGHSCGAAKLRLDSIKPQVQHMASIRPEEITQLMPILNSTGMEHTTRQAMLWSFHTLARPAEVAGARWDEIDMDRRLWVIPAERMKMKRDHIVPLTDSTLAILEAMGSIRRGPFIFPSRSSSSGSIHPQTINKMITTTLARTGLRMVSHGIRSLGSTTLNEEGWNPEWVELALAHVDKNTVRAIYNRADYIEARRGMMSWWSEHIEAAGRGEYTTRAESLDNVVAVNFGGRR